VSGRAHLHRPPTRRFKLDEPEMGDAREAVYAFSLNAELPVLLSPAILYCSNREAPLSL